MAGYFCESEHGANGEERFRLMSRLGDEQRKIQNQGECGQLFGLRTDLRAGDAAAEMT